MRAVLPPIPCRRPRPGRNQSRPRRCGFSVEFRAVKESRIDGDLRVIEDAILSGIGIVKSPSYDGARVEARRRSGPDHAGDDRVPSDTDLWSVRCSGAECKFAQAWRQRGCRKAYSIRAFQQFERETVIAGVWLLRHAPCVGIGAARCEASILGNGDGEVEIDLPAGIASALRPWPRMKPPA